MVDVVTDILIQCPVEHVRSYTINPDKAPDWYRSILSVQWITSKPLNIGSKIAFTAHFLGRHLSYTYEVIEMNNDNFVMRTSEGPFPMETTYAWEKLDNSACRLTLRNRGNPKGFSRILSPFIATMVRRANRKDLAKLKSILELRFD